MDNSECEINLYGWNYLALISANTQTPRIRRIYSVDGEWNPFKEWVTTISLLLVISLLAKVYNILEKSKEIGNYFWDFFVLLHHIASHGYLRRLRFHSYNTQLELESYIFQIINKQRKNKGEMGYEMETSDFLSFSLFCNAPKNT